MASEFECMCDACEGKAQGERMRVDIERVLELREELRKINGVQLPFIDFYKSGEKLEISPQAIREWHFTGLNNTDFIENGLYEHLTVYTGEREDEEAVGGQASAT